MAVDGKRRGGAPGCGWLTRSPSAVGAEIRVTVRAGPGRIDGMTAAFIPGLQLAEAFYDEAVRPLLDQAFPRLHYAAALLGAGSEVLG